MRGRLTVLTVLAVAAVSAGALLGRSSIAVPDPPPTTITSAAVDPVDGLVPVHVSGLVVAPGVVDVPADAIVADAIDAAGGFQTGALVDQINLAAPVSAGDHIVVPGPGTEADNPGDGGESGPISLNRATPAELEELPGVGPVLAERIASFRESNGSFEVVEDLLEVPGIGEAKLAAIRDLVRP